MSKCKLVDARSCELGTEVKECGRQDRHQGTTATLRSKLGMERSCTCWKVHRRLSICGVSTERYTQCAMCAYAHETCSLCSLKNLHVQYVTFAFRNSINNRLKDIKTRVTLSMAGTSKQQLKESMCRNAIHFNIDTAYRVSTRVRRAQYLCVDILSSCNMSFHSQTFDRKKKRMGGIDAKVHDLSPANFRQTGQTHGKKNCLIPSPYSLYS